MLGLYNYIANSESVQSIIRSGLQLFYKTNRTQAPLGEEQVRNNSFDELGIDEVTNGDFAADSDWTKRNGSTINNVANVIAGGSIGSNTDNWSLESLANVFETSKTYQIKFRAKQVSLAGSNAGNFQVGNSYGALFDEVITSEFVDYTFTAQTSSSYWPKLTIGGRIPGDVFQIDDISVKQVDPNNRWTLEAGWSINNGKATYNGSATDSAINQVSVTSGRNYKLEFTIEDYVSGTLDAALSDGSLGNNNIEADGTYSFNITATGTLCVFRSTDSFKGSISNISVKEITNSIKDHSRNSNDGVLYSGKALEFDTDDGSNDFIVLNDANLPGEFTVCTWVEPHSFTQCNIFGDTANQNWIRIHSALSIKVKINNIATGYSPIAHGGNIALNEWSRVVVTRGSDNVIRFGINGTLYSPSTTPRPGNFNFNRLGVKESLEMNGALADVQVYDKAWNATDVKYDWENPDKDVFDRVGEAQVLGSEEVTDGGFPTGTTAWDDVSGSGGSLTFGDGFLDLNTLGENEDGWVQQVLTLESGKTYQVEFTFNGNTLCFIGSSSKALDIVESFSNDTSGTRIITFTATQATIYLGFRNFWNRNNSSRLTNVSVKEVTTHASHILPTDCKSLLRLNEGAGDRVYDAALVLGAEEVVDGSFPQGTTAWTKGPSNDVVAFGDGFVDIHKTAPESDAYIYQDILQANRTYQVRFSGVISTGILFFGTNAVNTNDFVAGTYVNETFNFTTTNTDNFIIRNPGTGTTIDARLTDVSVKEIKPAESFFITGDKNFLHQQPYIPQYAMSSFSKKMVFDGSNDYVACGSDVSIDNIFTGGGTFSAWISPTTDGGENLGTIIGKGSVSIRVKEDDNDGVILNLAKGFSTTNADFLTSDEVVLENKMNHIAITYNDSAPSNTPLFYVNGVLKAIDTSSSTTPVGSASTDASSNLIIGNATAGGTRSFDGIIDEVSMFKTILTQDEVLELYNSGSSFDTTGHSKYNLGEEVSNGTFELGSEEITNGDFSDGTTGWQGSDAAANISISNNRLRLTNGDATAAGVVNSTTTKISFKNGSSYQISYESYQGTSTNKNSQLFLGTTQSGSSSADKLVGEIFTTDGIHRQHFKSTSNQELFLTIKNTVTTSGIYMEFDNISVKEIPNWELRPGWSVNNNTVVYDGTGSQYARIIQTLNTHVGRTYQMTFTLSGLSSGKTVNFGLGRNGAFIYQQQTYSSNGTYTRIMQAQSIDDDIMVQINQADANCTVSNISVQEYGLSAYWRNNGADQWDDLSINSNHGTVSGSPTEIFLQEVPFFGKDSLGMFMNKPRLGGLNFNKSGYVETGSTFQSTFRDSFSICFWFKFPDGQPSSAMRFLGHDVGEDELFISLEANGESKFQFRSNNDRVISKTDAAIASNNQTDWIYLTITLTKASTIGDAQIIFYKDGSAVNSSLLGTDTLTQANMELYTQTQNLVLGAFRNDQGNIGADTCDGIIDDFKIYSKALTAAEIKKNYNATKGKHKN